MKSCVVSGAMGLAGFVAGLLLATATAQADAIDGSWCHTEPSGQSSRFSINGPRIVTPAGTRTEGRYQRHYFAYVVPADELGAGTVVEMRLLGEEAVMVREGPQAAPIVWQRCGPPVS